MLLQIPLNTKRPPVISFDIHNPSYPRQLSLVGARRRGKGTMIQDETLYGKDTGQSEVPKVRQSHIFMN